MNNFQYDFSRVITINEYNLIDVLLTRPIEDFN